MSQNYWFKNKSYGWGWYPATWEGWLVLFVYVVILVWRFTEIDRRSHSVSDTLINFVPFVGILTVALILICYKTGEKPGWHWGDR
jgi:hypothetical protein